VSEKRLKETIGNMTEREKNILLKVLTNDGWTRLRIKKGKIEEAYGENKL
jgi:hypothetical protein